MKRRPHKNRIGGIAGGIELPAWAWHAVYRVWNQGIKGGQRIRRLPERF